MKSDECVMSTLKGFQQGWPTILPDYVNLNGSVHQRRRSSITPLQRGDGEQAVPQKHCNGLNVIRKKSCAECSFDTWQKPQEKERWRGEWTIQCTRPTFWHSSNRNPLGWKSARFLRSEPLRAINHSPGQPTNVLDCLKPIARTNTLADKQLQIQYVLPINKLPNNMGTIIHWIEDWMNRLYKVITNLHRQNA